MKKIIWGTIIFGVVLAAAIPFIAEVYVDKKDDREYARACENLKSFFAKQDKFVCVDYSGEKVAYDKAPIPKSPHEDYGGVQYSLWGAEAIKWNERWADIYKLYKLKPRYEPIKGPFGEEKDWTWTGWRFTVIEGFVTYPLLGFSVYRIYPYQVAYKRQENDWMYNYEPSVQEAIDDSFEFHVYNDKSSYKKYINNDVTVYDVKKAIGSNVSYYMLASYDSYVESMKAVFGERGKAMADSVIRSQNWNEISNYGIAYGMVNPYDKRYGGGMENGYYSVDNMYHPIEDWWMSYNFIHNPKVEDKRNFIIWSECSLFVLLLLIVVPLCIVDSKRRKIAKESLKTKLMRLSNPQLFMKPYDEKKVTVANELYDRVLKTSESDIEALKDIRREVTQKLGVDFVDKAKKKKLLSKVAPKNFMKPYDAEKVKLANELYTQLKNTNIDIDTLESIEREIAEKLYNK